MRGKTPNGKGGARTAAKVFVYAYDGGAMQDDWGKRFKARLAVSGKAPMVIIGAMMRKLIHVAFGYCDLNNRLIRIYLHVKH